MLCKTRFIAFLFFTLCSTTFSLRGQVVFELNENTPLSNLGSNIALYEDKTAALKIEDISNSVYSAKFINSTAPIPNYNLTNSKIWCRLQIINRSDNNDWYLVAGNAGVSNMEVYAQVSNRFTFKKGGFAMWAGSRDFFSNKPVFHIDLPKDSLRTFYIAFTDHLPLQAHFSIGNIKSLIHDAHKNDFLNGAFFGLLLMLVIYNLFIFFSVRDRVFVYYILYVFANALFISFANGYGCHLPNFITSVMVSHPTFVPFMLGITACLFMLNFLNVKHNFPVGYKITMVLMSIFTIVPPLDWIGFTIVGVTIVQILGLVMSVFSVIVGLVVLRKGYRPARFYLLAFGFYLVGLFTYIASDAQLITFTEFSHNSLQFGTAFEAILLSLAVGDKISNFKKDKELAQEEALAAAKENERLVREQNILLEQKVKERTTELQQQKELVEEKNKDILDSIRYAKRIQISLMPQESYIQKVLKRLRGGENKE